MNRKKKAALSLALLVPAPSIGAWAGLVLFPDSPMGKAIFGLTKIWLLCLPLVWNLWVNKERISLSSPKKGGFGMGVLSGLVMNVFILSAYWLLGEDWIYSGLLVEKMDAVGLASPSLYIRGAAYWILVNSVLEEYVWRWFVLKQSTVLFRPMTAVLCSALFFTLHHIVAMQVYLGIEAVALCSAGVFVGGAIWCLMYMIYRSIWPGYLSHAIVDLCVFGIGAYIIFGGPAG